MLKQLAIFNGLENSFSAILNSTDNDFKLNLNTNLIRANSRNYFYKWHYCCSGWDDIFDDVMLSMESLGTSSIVFAYCDGDHFKHSFGKVI
jgi:hypothetical protein